MVFKSGSRFVCVKFTIDSFHCGEQFDASKKGILFIHESSNVFAMQISVVIPTYKRPLLLARCIEALSKQNYPGNFEIVIVSDGPDEQTKELVRQLSSTCRQALTFYSLKEKKGPAAARNLGWQHSLSSLIAFTDDDCIPDQNWLKEIHDLYIKNSLSSIAYSGRIIVPVSAVPTDYEKNIAHLSTAEFITANCAISKEALEKVGGLDERFTMAWREDSDLQFRLMEHNIPIIKNDNAIVTHPVRQAPWGISLKEEKKGIYNALLYKKYPKLYKQKIQPDPPWNYYLIILSFITVIAGIFKGSDVMAVAGLLVWVTSTARFIFKRLKGTSKAFRHTSEMIFTSWLIPFLSIYYRIYGAIKFKTPLIP
jgi:glycosyltransferase involved in cell wall biosynthesis